MSEYKTYRVVYDPAGRSANVGESVAYTYSGSGVGCLTFVGTGGTIVEGPGTGTYVTWDADNACCSYIPYGFKPLKDKKPQDGKVILCWNGEQQGTGLFHKNKIYSKLENVTHWKYE